MLPQEISRRAIADHQRELELLLTPSLFWFRGHFSQLPILPGVAQVDWVLHYARHTGLICGQFGGIENVKFQYPVRPGQRLLLSLEWRQPQRQLQFRYQLIHQPDADEPITVSSGKIKICP
ncbi:ApeI family dehydratase [Biostraticola tofi]|uniref:FabA-like protein n=1 Tax=Biostraticola tofi TaxID=466109 RepID=A0A4R3YR61_9GAMM|nr:hydroxymyristoyl-ACP dehydratase [Biostraticola tofi]TCV95435.1 FabA-like protein [Biostraticola tofi]